jgi:uncharacterized membrane protein YkvA (DUF1232 family)
MLERLKSLGFRFKQELEVYQGILKDPRTPPLARLLLGAAIAYALMPFDLIPDWIPVLGYLDDILIVPTLVATALILTPKHVIEEHRQAITRSR